MSFTVIIPARYASTRFAGKPLADLAGKPMVVRVCERAKESGALAVHVATDDERIAAAVRQHGFGVVYVVGEESTILARKISAIRIASSRCSGLV